MTFEREFARSNVLLAITSSTISAVAYDEQASVLTVLFSNQSLYDYYGVPAWLYEALLDAQPHPWTAAGREVRSYPTRRVEGRICA